MKTQLEMVADSEESKMIQCQRNGDGKLTELFVYIGLFGDLKKRFGKENDWASIMLLDDLRTGWFWWQYAALISDEVYAKKDIDTRLSRWGYWEENDGIYIYHNTVRNPRELIYLSENNIVKFRIKRATLYMTEAQKRHDEFVQGYNQTILKITERLEKKEQINERTKAISLRMYLDDRLFRIPNFCGIACGIADIGELISVTRQDDKWTIELAGVDWKESDRTTKALYVKDWLVEWQEGSHRAKVTIVLNGDYEVVEVLAEDCFKKQKDS